MTERRVGEWPVPPAPAAAVDEANEREEQYLAVAAEKARFHVTLGALRGALEEQPSPAAVRSCLRRWISAATQTAEEVTREKRTKKEGDQ